MSYQALYRRYRPASFAEVIGQEHITTILKNQVSSGHTSHAYLFTGTRGTGKTSVARILARAVNCLEPVGGEPCGKCSACRISEGGGIDIIEMDAASNTGVDDVRAILDKVRFTPLELSTKVYIIDEAHALSGNAFNALLKTLEEPPEHILFILATTEPQRVPATIISRCQRMDFHRLSVADITACAKNVLARSGAYIDDAGLLAIARAAEGGMRDALSLADQCVAFCGNNVTAAQVYNVLGSMDNSFMFELADALIDSDIRSALTLLERVINSGRDLKVLVHDLAQHMRALLLAKLCGSCADVLDCTQDDMLRYASQAERCGEIRLLRATELLMQTQQNLRWLTLPRVLIESTLIRIAHPEEKRTLDDLLERIESLEAQMKSGVSKALKQPVMPQCSEQMPQPVQEIVHAIVQQPEYVQQPAPATDASAIWNTVREKLGQSEPAAAVMMINAKKLAIDGNTLVAGFDKAIYLDTLSKPRFKEALANAVSDVAPGFSLKLIMAQDYSLEERARELFGSGLESL
ncbi:MAG: DNA polymerase III subunit gamma/tau [Clostridia bacterium]